MMCFKTKQWAFIFATLLALLWLVPEADARGRGGRSGGRAATALIGVAVGTAAALLTPRNDPPPRRTIVPQRRFDPAPMQSVETAQPALEQPAPVPAPVPLPPAREMPPPAQQQVAKPLGCTPTGWCYTLYNPDGSIAESGPNPPKIDLSYPPRDGQPRPHVLISNAGNSASGSYADYGSRGSYANYGSRSSSGPVFVRSYTRSDGTHVRSHFRSAPRR